MLIVQQVNIVNLNLNKDNPKSAHNYSVGVAVITLFGAQQYYLIPI